MLGARTERGSRGGARKSSAPLASRSAEQLPGPWLYRPSFTERSHLRDPLAAGGRSGPGRRSRRARVRRGAGGSGPSPVGLGWPMGWGDGATSPGETFGADIVAGSARSVPVVSAAPRPSQPRVGVLRVHARRIPRHASGHHSAGRSGTGSAVPLRPWRRNAIGRMPTRREMYRTARGGEYHLPHGRESRCLRPQPRHESAQDPAPPPRSRGRARRLRMAGPPRRGVCAPDGRAVAPLGVDGQVARVPSSHLAVGLGIAGARWPGAAWAVSLAGTIVTGLWLVIDLRVRQWTGARALDYLAFLAERSPLEWAGGQGGLLVPILGVALPAILLVLATAWGSAMVVDRLLRPSLRFRSAVLSGLLISYAGLVVGSSPSSGAAGRGSSSGRWKRACRSRSRFGPGALSPGMRC